MKKCILLLIILFNLSLSEIVISGFITNKNTGEVLIGANVFISNSKNGVITDKNGFYSIVIDDKQLNNIDIIIQYLGYAPLKKNITLNSKSIINDFELLPANIQIQATEIKGEKESRQTVTQYSSIKVTQAQLSSLPSLAEADIFRTLQSLPGVLQSSEFSTGLIIRGGNTDQNLILLDGITVYNPSHLGGIFSNFIVEAIKEANLTKGGYNAEYGGRLSAVLDVISREGNRKDFK